MSKIQLHSVRLHMAHPVCAYVLKKSNRVSANYIIKNQTIQTQMYQTMKHLFHQYFFFKDTHVLYLKNNHFPWMFNMFRKIITKLAKHFLFICSKTTNLNTVLLLNFIYVIKRRHFVKKCSSPGRIVMEFICS